MFHYCPACGDVCQCACGDPEECRHVCPPRGWDDDLETADRDDNTDDDDEPIDSDPDDGGD